MVQVPYPVSGICYDNDGTTILASVRVSIYDATNNSTASVTTNSSGEYLFDLANLTNGYSIGDSISIYSSYGRYYDEVIFTTDSTGIKEQDLTLDHELETAVLYTSVAAVRGFTKVQASEWTDTQIASMIRYATGDIDRKTGRTWKGVQTVTDEYYDGNDDDTLYLNHTDLQSVTSVAVDNMQTGTYTTIDTSPFVYSNWIVLNRNGNYTTFPANPQSAKITYTYGNSAPTQEVRELCNLMVANMIHLERSREERIKELVEYLKWKNKGGVW